MTETPSVETAEGAVVGDLRKQLAAAETPAGVAKVNGAR